MLKKIFEKSELWFALIFIILYVSVNSFLLQASEAVGYEMLFTIPFNMILFAMIFLFAKRYGLFDYYGLCKVKTKAGNLLFYIPLFIIATVNIWMGVCFKMDLIHTVIYFAAMVFTGMAEEILFRGLLFRAIGKKNMRNAIIITSILFGVGHIVNLINGNSENVVETVCQILYAIAIGFLFAAVLYVGKSILPCIITHAALNALSSFANETAFVKIQIPVSITLCVISGVSALVIFKNYFTKKEKWDL